MSPKHSAHPNPQPLPSHDVNLTWKVLTALCCVVAVIIGYLYVTAVSSAADAACASKSNIDSLTADKVVLAARVEESDAAKTAAQAALADASIKEKISGVYTNVDLSTGSISSAADQLIVMYDQGKLTVAQYSPYVVNSNVTVTSTGKMLGTFAVKLKYDFASAQTFPSGSTYAGKYILTTTNGTGASAQIVKLIWSSEGGCLVLVCGNAQLVYIKNSY